MTARAPTTFVQWADGSALLPSKRIVETTPDQICDNAEFLLDSAQIIIATYWPIPLTFGDLPTSTLAEWSVYFPDMADLNDPPSGFDVHVACRAWVDTGTGSVDIAGTNLTGPTISITATTPTWVHPTASTDGATLETTLQTLSLTAWNATPGNIWLDAILVWLVP